MGADNAQIYVQGKISNSKMSAYNVACVCSKELSVVRLFTPKKFFKIFSYLFSRSWNHQNSHQLTGGRKRDIERTNLNSWLVDKRYLDNFLTN